MTIHSGHPFATPQDDRDLARRLRGRLGGQVSLWTAGCGADRVGLTVSSLLVEPGDPPYVVGLIDPDSDLADHLQDAESPRLVVSLLEWRHRELAQQFAGQMPAPGGLFATHEWVQTPAGPRLADVTTWTSVEVTELRDLGWRLLVTGELGQTEIGSDDDPLVHRRGRYLRLGSDRE